MEQDEEEGGVFAFGWIAVSHWCVLKAGKWWVVIAYILEFRPHTESCILEVLMMW